nr:hypothetical protein [Roseibium hamelinense]
MAFLLDEAQLIEFICCPDHSSAADFQKLHEPADAGITLASLAIEVIYYGGGNTACSRRQLGHKAHGFECEKDVILLEKGHSDPAELAR